jgi:DNA polymerase-3 subunit delta
VLVASKLHGQRRLVTTAKKEGFIVTCDRLARRDVPDWIHALCRDKGHPIDTAAADQLAEMAGSELGHIADAVERLSLYVGPKQAITEDAVANLVTRVRQSSAWELVDALGRRRLDRALATLADVLDARDGGLPVLGAIAWSVRQLVKFESVLATGATVPEAAQRAGVPPFKANDLAHVVRSASPGMLHRWLALLSEADLALKGSKRPPAAVLETLCMDMCR